MATPTTAGLIVLKQPRTGSTWLKAELNALPGVFLRFEPLSDTRFNTSECAPSFTNLILARLLREARAMRCVSRKLKDDPCYWAKQRCRDAHQFGRVEVVRGILARGLRSRKEAVRHVPVYEILSPRWQDHPGNILGHTDCTHYGRVSNELVWKALIAAGEV